VAKFAAYAIKLHNSPRPPSGYPLKRVEGSPIHSNADGDFLLMWAGTELALV